MDFKGGCHCRQIRYRITHQPRLATICHCTECRGSTGAPVVAWATVPREALILEKGHIRIHRSLTGDGRGFCDQCGTQLVFLSKDKADTETDFTIASLDDPDRIPPQDDVWTRSRIKWVSPISHGPRYDQERLPPGD